MDLLEHGDDGNRVHSSNQAAKEKVLQQADVQVAYSTGKSLNLAFHNFHISFLGLQNKKQDPCLPMAPPM